MAGADEMLPIDQRTEVLGSQRLTGALLGRLTHRVHILEINGESYRFRESVCLAGKKHLAKTQLTVKKTKIKEEEAGNKPQN